MIVQITLFRDTGEKIHEVRASALRRFQWAGVPVAPVENGVCLEGYVFAPQVSEEP